MKDLWKGIAIGAMWLGVGLSGDAAPFVAVFAMLATVCVAGA